MAGQLLDDRTSPGTVFEVIGVDFAGPVKFRKSNKAEAKAYLCIFACSLSRAIHLELLRNLETSTFIMCLKQSPVEDAHEWCILTMVVLSSKLASGWSSYRRTRSNEGSLNNTKLIGNLILVANPGGAASLSASDVAEKEKTVRLNPDVPRFEPRPTRDAAAAARLRIRSRTDRVRTD